MRLPPMLTLWLLLALTTTATTNPLNILLRRSYLAREKPDSSGLLDAPGGWLSRLGWGLGEASVSIVDRDPIISHLARVAFFGTAIPKDGLVGYVIPLNSFTAPCPQTSASLHPSTNFEPAASLTTPGPSAHDLPALSRSSSLPPDVTPNDPGRSLDEDLDDNTGCPTLCPTVPGRYPSTNETWFALVRRGDCDFVKKAREAQRLGAKALIVGSLTDELLSMSSKADDPMDVRIPAIYIMRTAYVNITDLIGQSETTVHGIKTVSAMLVGEPPWEWYTPILSFLVVLTLPSFLTLCTLLVHRARAARAARLERAPEDIVNSLPSRVWNGSYWEKDVGQSSLPRPQPKKTATVPGLGERSGLLSGYGPSAGYGAVENTTDSANMEPSTSAPKAIPPMHVPSYDEEPTVPPLSSHASSSTIPKRPEEEARASPAEQEAPAQSPEEGHASRPREPETPRPPWFHNQIECPICLCTFEIGDRVRVLPCGHIFHQHEVDPWLLQQRKVCPVCKYDVTFPPPPTSPPHRSIHVEAAGPLLETGVLGEGAEQQPPSNLRRLREWLSSTGWRGTGVPDSNLLSTGEAIPGSDGDDSDDDSARVGGGRRRASS